jgi:hypothetical protein
MVDRLAPSLLAAVVTLSGATAIDAAYAPAAHANDEEVRPLVESTFQRYLTDQRCR